MIHSCDKTCIYMYVCVYIYASRGVAVLFKNSFEFHIYQEIIDECGNFIILDILGSGCIRVV